MDVPITSFVFLRCLALLLISLKWKTPERGGSLFRVVFFLPSILSPEPESNEAEIISWQDRDRKGVLKKLGATQNLCNSRHRKIRVIAIMETP
jgi:hypothetical protein